MLDKTQLVDLFDRLGMPRAGRDLVLRARTHAPVRDVKSRCGNVITLLASRKMGCEIRTESRHIEFAAAVDKEYDPSVLEYYAQPCELKLELVDYATGEIRNIRHFPDFLDIREDGFTLEEWKSSDKLTRLAEKYPYRYVKGNDGCWRSPQIEKQLADIGIRYRICTDDDIPRRRVENLLHLADYFHPGADPCPEHFLARLNAALQEHGAIYFAELCARPYDFSADALYKAVADNLVVADLDREALTNQHHARLYRDVTLREFLAGEVRHDVVPGQERFVQNIAVGARFQYESQELTISLVGEKEVICTQRGGTIVTLSRTWLEEAFTAGQITPLTGPTAQQLDLTRYTKEELDIALRRHAILQSQSTHATVSERTQRRWLAKQNAALANGGNEVIALVPRTNGRGNRSDRLSDQQEHPLSHIIQTKWRSHEAINYKACYRELQAACTTANIKAPSYPTLIARIKAEETSHDLRIRHGKRMAYQMSEFVDVLYVDTPVHGSRPFQYVHIDHTQFDIELISSRTDKPLGRPWLSFAVDAWSRRIVAFYLTFDPPSYHSVMMVMRDMVRRFKRLPEFVVVDNGRDFMSATFETFLQVMGVHLRFRPAGQPRHGAVLERLFGRVHTEYIHNLAGNTKATKNVRMVTGKHLPVNFAEWTLEALYFGIEHWATDYYDQERHPALDCSPRDAFLRGQRESGTRAHKQVLFNQDFLIATCPPVDREGVRLVNRQRGVKVNGLLYWSPEFRDPRVAGQRLPVRYDPWDASTVYVRLNNNWTHALCRNLLGLGQLTELERRALTEEYTHQSGLPVEDERSSQRLREFMQVFTPEGALAAAFERQQENKSLYNTLQLGAISQPVAPFTKFSLTEDTSRTVKSAEIRPLISQSTGTPSEAMAPNALPDFDVF
ncbi:integrase [Noviherbaspirillum cavernae]|uniref:Integrase n=1 Tax=Noviherbaspirillum cavernae TaxID=2320862 RepID=A0A418X6J8_9BURK|nr:Mu transposase C-terminal domain-containing protein [Noviherbaspirillum cavernae]RJG07971.1 integrase [Noviherbaspirillum cavernae]